MHLSKPLVAYLCLEIAYLSVEAVLPLNKLSKHRPLTPESHAYDGGSFVESESDRMYVCRISEMYGACASRAYDQVHADAHCPDGMCCSKTATFHNSGVGNWCTNSWAYCSSSIIYNSNYSYGSCSCKNFGSKCPANMFCVDDGRERGGAYCVCKDGYVNQGGSCVPELCASNTCGVRGECFPDYQRGTYKCQCEEGFVYNGSKCEIAQDLCTADICGPPEMVSSCSTPTPDTHKCICKLGYEIHENRCRPTDICKPDTCGDAQGVESCTTVKKDVTMCVCKAGYKLDSNSKCVSDGSCPDLSVCGPVEGVNSCERDGDKRYECTCKSDYVLSNVNGKEQCVLKDICVSAGNPCGKGLCTADPSQNNKYSCECESGYRVEGKGTYVEHCVQDVCAGHNSCGSHGKCVPNSGGSYTCECAEGYKLDTRNGSPQCVHTDLCHGVTCESHQHCIASADGVAECVDDDDSSLGSGNGSSGNDGSSGDDGSSGNGQDGSSSSSEKPEAEREESSNTSGIALAASFAVLGVVAVSAGGYYTYNRVSGGNAAPTQEEDDFEVDASGENENASIIENDITVTPESSHWA